MSDLILGADISSLQGRCDFVKMRDEGGIRFLWIRSSGAIGGAGIDPLAKANAAGARAAGLPAGPYHVFHHGQAAERSAEACIGAVDDLGWAPGDLPPVIDAEIPYDVKDIAGTVVSSLERFVEAFERRFLRMPVIYGYKPWYDQLGAALTSSSVLAGCEFWVAAYPFLGPYPKAKLNVSKLPKTPKIWPLPIAWQYSGNHSEPLPGVPRQPCMQGHKDCRPIDRNVFLGDELAFARFRGLEVGEGGPVHGTHVVEASLARRGSCPDDR